MTDLDGAWTDAVLASVSLAGGAWLGLRVPGRGIAAAGQLLVGCAAAVGTFRLAGDERLGPLHDALSGIAGLVGVPLLALGVVVKGLDRATARAMGWVASGVAAGLIAVYARYGPALANQLEVPVAGVMLAAAIVVGGRAGNRFGTSAALLVLIAGLGIAGPGSWLGFSRLGWFHLALAVASLGFAAALRPDRGQAPTPTGHVTPVPPSPQ